ncbi:MAG: tyrosine-type recombinase/integrase [Lachnospiraceae bacterium]|nr:tyrosine-type recombinase/integrase [Lachnospiraceae bacterium]
MGDSLGHSASTINCRFAAIRSYLEYVSDGDASIIPIYLIAERVPSASVPKVQRPVIEAGDLAAFLDSPAHTRKGNRDRFILILLYDTAIRVEELVNIRLGDVTIGKNSSSILIHGKGRKERRIVLSKKASEHLKAYVSCYHDSALDPECPLIYTVIHGETHPMSARNVERILHKYGEITKATNPNLPDSVYPHMMRRTRACGLYQDGVPMEQVAALLGHSNIETTRTHYAKPSKKQMQESMEKGVEQEPDTKEWVGKTDEIKRKFGLL